MALEIGSIVEGKVSGIMPFGAFVDLPDGKTGLVHISEVARDYVKDIREHLTEKQTVRVKVLSIDKNGKISLSIKRAQSEEGAKPQGPVRPDDGAWGSKANADSSFEEKMAMFKKSSEEKMQTLKRGSEVRRPRKNY